MPLKLKAVGHDGWVRGGAPITCKSQKMKIIVGTL